LLERLNGATSENQDLLDDMLEPERLHIFLYGAQDLSIMDYNLVGAATSDPYVKLNLLSIGADAESGVRKSETKIKNLNPEWNERHHIDVYDPNESLEVTVWDYDMVGDDDLMGKVVIPLADLANKKWRKQWYTLTNDEEEAQEAKNADGGFGKVELGLYWGRASDVRTFAAIMSQEEEHNSPASKSNAMLDRILAEVEASEKLDNTADATAPASSTGLDTEMVTEQQKEQEQQQQQEQEQEVIVEYDTTQGKTKPWSLSKLGKISSAVGSVFYKLRLFKVGWGLGTANARTTRPLSRPSTPPRSIYRPMDAPTYHPTSPHRSSRARSGSRFHRHCWLPSTTPL